MVLHFAASQPERCEAVRRDHVEFATWAQSSLAQFNASRHGTPSSEDRALYRAFEAKVEIQIDALNRRFAKCKED